MAVSTAVTLRRQTVSTNVGRPVIIGDAWHKSRIAASNAVIAPDLQYVQTAGYSSPGDGGGALYKRVGSEPSHAGKFQSADGAWFELVNDRPNAKMFGAKADGETDDTAALNAACAFCKIKNVPLFGVEAGTHYVNGAWTFDCNVRGGRYAIGTLGAARLQVETAGSLRRFDGFFQNASGDDLKQGLLCISNDISTPTRKGHVSVKLEMHGFLKGVYGQYLESFIVEGDGSSFESTNEDLDRFAEAHVACHSTDLFIVKDIVSEGGVLGILSGANVVVDIYLGCVIRDTTDHAIYSSSPGTTQPKQLTIFDGVQSINAGNVGLKCFSNGDLYAKNCTVRDATNEGIIAVANRAYVAGGIIDGAGGSGVYQIGKAVGAGVNEFAELTVRGVTMRRISTDGVRVSGPAKLDHVKISDCDIEVARRPLFINTGTIMKTVEINGGKLKGETAADQLLFVSATAIDKVSITRSMLIHTKASAVNLIDILNAEEVYLTDPVFEFVTCASLVRQRNAAATLYAQGVRKIAGFCTRLDQMRSDGGLVVYEYGIAPSGLLLRRGFASSVPSTGTWERGEWLKNSTPSANGDPGWVCTISGTFGTLSSVTGSITTGTAVLTVNDAASLALGQYITIAGVSGARRIIGISGTAIALGSNANATVSDAAVAWSAPVFNAEANIDA